MIPPLSTEKSPMLSSPIVGRRSSGAEVQAEEAEDDRRNPGDRLEQRLDDVAEARARILGQEGRRKEPERDRDDERDHRDRQRSRDQREDPVGLRP